MIAVPAGLAARVRAHLGAAAGDSWLDGLPGLAQAFLDRWGLRLDDAAGGPWHGYESLVLPVTTSRGVAAVLRLAAEDTDPLRHAREAASLRLWDGRGAVRLLADDEGHRVSLLERLDPGRDLGTVPLDETVPAWGRIMKELAVGVPEGPGGAAPPFETVQGIAAGWLRDFPARSAALLPAFGAWTGDDAGLLESALGAAHELSGSGGTRLLHADLHQYNVLAEPPGGIGWRAIDPKPLTGPPEFALAPMLWNRLYDQPGAHPEEQAASLRGYARDLSGAAGLDHRLALAASVGRELENLFWYLADGDVPAAERSLWVARAAAGHGVRGADARSLARLV